MHTNSGVLWPWLLTLVLGAFGAVILVSLIRLPRVVYKVTDRGITLFNISDQEIPWRNVKNVSVIENKGGSLLVLNFMPDFRLKRLKFISQKSVTLSSKLVRASFTELLRVVREAHSNFHDGADPAS